MRWLTCVGSECTWLQTAGFISALMFSRSGPVGPRLFPGGGQADKSQAHSHVGACGAPMCIAPAAPSGPQTAYGAVVYTERGRDDYLLNSGAVGHTNASAGMKGSWWGACWVTPSFTGCLCSCSESGRTMLDSWLRTCELDFMTGEL